MKFHQLKTGESFTFQGEAFRKVSPLLAHNEKDGLQKMFRRADSVELSGACEQPDTGPYQTDQIVNQKIETCMKQLLASCEKIVETHISDKISMTRAIDQLHKEYNLLINSLV